MTPHEQSLLDDARMRMGMFWMDARNNWRKTLACLQVVHRLGGLHEGEEIGLARVRDEALELARQADEMLKASEKRRKAA